MGANFVYAIAEIDQSRQYWLDKLNNLNVDNIADIADELGNYLYDFDELDGAELVEAVKARVADSINESYDAYEGSSREASSLHLTGDRNFVITGGMSWGDAPTDVFDHIALFDTFRYWANKDN